MASISLGKKHLLLSNFKSIPKTSVIENEQAQLIKTFEEFNEFESSEELAAFYELESYIHSDQHKNIISHIENTRAEDTNKEEHYKSQKKSREFKRFFKCDSSQNLKRFKNIEESEELKQYYELEKLTNSDEFVNQLHNKETKEEILEDLKKQVKAFKKLEKSKNIKWYHKFKHSSKYTTYINFLNSTQLAEFFDLEEYLKSENRNQLLADIDKLDQEEKEKIRKYEEFKKSEKYTWYQKIRDNNEFHKLKEWELVFEDDFDGTELNKNIWSTRYYQGEKLLNDAYVLSGEQAFLTDGDNLSINNSCLKINIKREKASGKVWNPPFGFTPTDFDFTSGIINSGKGFKGKYGKLEAKIKIDFHKSLYFNFWLGSETALPHIDVFKVKDKKSQIQSGHFWPETRENHGQSMGQFKGLNPSADFFIYTLEWSGEKMTWKINNQIVHEQTQHIPNEEMYMVFSAGVAGKVNSAPSSASMDIDWVRWYKKAK